MIGYPTADGAFSDAIYINQLGETFVRAAPLALNWTRVRVGMFYSLCGLTKDADPSAETLARLGPLDQIMFGIGNGVNAYGEAGNRFVGITSINSGNIAPLYSGTYDYWQLNNSALWGAIGDGTTVVQTTTNNATTAYGRHNQAESTRFAAYIGADIALSGTGAVVGISVGPVNAPYGVANTSEANLLRCMIDPASAGMSAVYNATVTGGWWSADPVNMRHIMVRIPYTQNRLRIHALRAIQLG